MNMITPYYVIHKQELDTNYFKLVSALEKYWNNYIIGYSYKTNALPWLIKHFDSLGCYAETVSEDEYNLAKLINVSRDKIIYNGPIKTKETFIEAINNNCIINIDSKREIEWLDDVKEEYRKIGIRINFDIEELCPGQSQSPSEGGRFGFCYENGELEKVIKILRQKKVNIEGIHLHTSSKTRSVDIYKAIAKVACKVKEEFNLNLKYVDIGGGFFGGMVNKPQFDEYIYEIEKILSKCYDKKNTTLIVEPGMAVVGSPVSYVTSVIDVKDTNYNKFVITDGSRTNIDPLMTKRSYFYNYELNSERDILRKQVICGYTCMENDRIFEEMGGPELKVGDKIVYEKVGAYTMCLTPLFIKYFPDVYVEENGKYVLVRRAWSPEQYIMNSNLEV